MQFDKKCSLQPSNTNSLTIVVCNLKYPLRECKNIFMPKSSLISWQAKKREPSAVFQYHRGKNYDTRKRKGEQYSNTQAYLAAVANSPNPIYRPYQARQGTSSYSCSCGFAPWRMSPPHQHGHFLHILLNSPLPTPMPNLTPPPPWYPLLLLLLLSICFYSLCCEQWWGESGGGWNDSGSWHAWQGCSWTLHLQHRGKKKTKKK